MAAPAGRREFWQAHVEAWRESGLTQRAYSREHELPEWQLSHWKHRLQCESCHSGNPCSREYARCVNPLLRQASTWARQNSRRSVGAAMPRLHE